MIKEYMAVGSAELSKILKWQSTMPKRNWFIHYEYDHDVIGIAEDDVGNVVIVVNYIGYGSNNWIGYIECREGYAEEIISRRIKNLTRGLFDESEKYFND